MLIKRWCECCGKEFEWENECKCGKNKHHPVCSGCQKIRQEAQYKNIVAKSAEDVAEVIERHIAYSWNRELVKSITWPSPWTKEQK